MIHKFKEFDRKLGLRFRKPKGILFRPLDRFKLWQARKNSKYSQDRLVQKEIEEGAYFFDNIYDKKLIDDIKTQIEPRLTDDSIAEVRKQEGIEVFRGISFDPSEISGMYELLEKSEIKDKVHAYFGSDYQIGISRYLRYEHVPENKQVDLETANSREWHLDTSAAANSVRFLVFLTDQTENGEFKSIGAKQTEELLGNYSYQQLREKPDLITENSKVETYSGERGSALLANVVKQLHTGVGPAKGQSRDVLILSFLPKK